MDKRRILLYTLAGAVSAWAGANAFLGGGDAPPAGPQATALAPSGAPQAVATSAQPGLRPASPIPSPSAVSETKSALPAPQAAPEKVAAQSPVVINSPVPAAEAQSKPASAIPSAQPAPAHASAAPVAAAPATDAKMAAPASPALPIASETATPAQPPSQAFAAAPAPKASQPAVPVTAEAADSKQLEPVAQPAAASAAPSTPAGKDEAVKLKAADPEPGAPVTAAKVAKANGKAASGLAKVWDESTRSITDKERSEAEARDKGGPEQGLPDDHPMVRDVLAKYKGEPLVLCVGGCEGHTVVLDRSSASTSRGVYVPSSAWASRRVKEYGDDPGLPGSDVVCVAGCNGAKGAAVWKPVRHSALGGRADAGSKAESDSSVKE